MLSKKGKRVLLVDADPQCNLTGIVLGYHSEDEMESLYQSGRNILDGIKPALEGQPVPIEAVDPYPIEGMDNLLLLPGHLKISEQESTFAMAHELTGPGSSLTALQNIPGSIATLLNKTAEKYKLDYIILDMNPSLGAINKNMLMLSDYFIIPNNPSYFSMMAIDSLANTLPNWAKWLDEKRSIFEKATYPYPASISRKPRFIGQIMQRFQPYGGSPASAFQKWIARIKELTLNKLLPALDESGILHDCHRDFVEKGYLSEEEGYILEYIPDFKSLLAKSEENRRPIFALSEEQIGETGIVLERMLDKRRQYEKLYENIANKVILMTDIENCA